MLQNFPGTWSFPASRHSLGELSRYGTLPGWAKLWRAVSILLLPGAGLLAYLWPQPAVWLGCSLMVLLLLLSWLWLATAPRREMLRYLQAGRLTPLSERQRRALQPNIVHCYNRGWWIETLEMWPCSHRLPHTRGYWLLDIEAEPACSRSSLKSDWDIESREDYLHMFDRLQQGLHTQYLLSPDASAAYVNLTDELAWLTQSDPKRVARLWQEQDGKPAHLIWGFDLWRASNMARMAWQAQYISEAEAWAHIEAVAEQIFQRFASLDEFFFSYLVGFAFWNRNKEDCEDRVSFYTVFVRQCHWPRAKTLWGWQ